MKNSKELNKIILKYQYFPLTFQVSYSEQFSKKNALTTKISYHDKKVRSIGGYNLI